jgi:hypothetical protein
MMIDFALDAMNVRRQISAPMRFPGMLLRFRPILVTTAKRLPDAFTLMLGSGVGSGDSRWALHDGRWFDCLAGADLGTTPVILSGV